MGDLEKNKESLPRPLPDFLCGPDQSALAFAAGGNDPRCPKEEALQVVDAVKKRGGVAEFKVYENEGHGFAGSKTRLMPTSASRSS